MIARPKEFYTGLFMMISFIIVFIIFMSPVFNGKNGLDFLDNFYNSISKSSSYYVPKLKKNIEAYSNNAINVSLDLDKKEHETAISILTQTGLKPVKEGEKINIKGDLKPILENMLIDADLMVFNDGAKIRERYNGINEKKVMFLWWKIAGLMDKELKKQEKFNEAAMIDTIKKKAVEQSYNYYGVKMESVKDKVFMMAVSLIFYVIYTIWYGYSILFLFEGIGLKIGH